jgi:hypothetical protein
MKTLTLFDARDGARKLSLEASDKPFHRLGFSADGALMVAVERDRGRAGGRARVVSVPDGREVRAVEDEKLIDVALSPDGRRLAAAFWTGETRLIDIATGEALHAIQQRFIEPAVSVAFTQDGDSLIIGRALGYIERWPVWRDTAAAIAHARGISPRCLTPDQRKRFFLKLQPPDWCKGMAKWPYAP